MGDRKIHLNIFIALSIIVGIFLMPGISAKALTKTFDGQSTMIVDQDCTINITGSFDQKATLIIKSGNVTINGNCKMMSAVDKESWESLPSGYNSSYFRNSILVDTAANVTINDLSINYNDINCEFNPNLVNQVICVRGKLNAKNLKILNAPDRGIKIEGSGTCTMTNESTINCHNTERSGYHAGVDVYGTFNMNGGTISQSTCYGIKVQSGGVANLNGGSVTNIMMNHDTEKSSGVHVYAGGTLNVNGTVISNCDFGINSAGTVNFTKGEIKNNTTGAMCAVKVAGGTFNMSGGSIHDSNVLLGSSGGIVVVTGNFNMTGGTICRCNGGVYLAGGTMTMTGGSISECQQRGIYVTPTNNNTALRIGGSAVIENNPSSSSNSKCNVLLGSDKKIIVTSALKSGAKIGVTTQTTPTSFNPVVITSGLSGRGTSTNFIADNSSYAIGMRGSEAVIALNYEIHTVTFNSDGGTAVPSQTIYTGEKVTAPANPTKTNYNFTGWYDRYGNKWNFANALGEDITLYAKWEKHHHSFSYSASGNTIIATCTNHTNCTLANKNYQVKMSIEPPDIATPGMAGSANAKLVGVNDFNAVTGLSIWDGNVTYIGRDGTSYPEIFAPPIADGKYRAKLTVKGAVAVVDYTLGNATSGNNPGSQDNGGGNSESQKNGDGSETITETSKSPSGALLISVISVDKNGDTVENMTFETLSSNKVSLISYKGKKKKVVVPNTIKAKGITYRVVSIGDGVFKSNKKITSMTLGKYVTSIGSNTFKSTKNLKTYSIKGTLTEVGKNAFKSTNKKAVITIKANKKNFKKTKKLIQKAGLAKSVKIRGK
ncbi:InlB B-repeat-containing protein [Butyrivibrio sp. AE3006]|uniref:InlB B-repeat-containing protein n=1 Tax=Butyrivibrio sp. AE3006 TaxID=1280673 RepID=UPI00047BF45F|nr:InlB B-repeat-containing protein [Butyrivibrio sp. AE3006]